MTGFAPKVTGGHILFVPPAHVIHGNQPIALCRVPVTGDGDLCLHPSYSEDERQHHAVDCAQKNASAIHAFRKRQHPDIMRPWDPELESWMGQHKDAILSGRKTV